MSVHIIGRRCLIAISLSALVSLGACASTKSVDEAKAMASKAQATADEALAEAKTANDKVDALGERTDRMYQQSLRK